MTCVVCKKVARYEVCAPINQLKTLARGMHTNTLIREIHFNKIQKYNLKLRETQKYSLQKRGLL